MDFSGGTGQPTCLDTEHRTQAVPIARRTDEPDPDAGFAGGVAKEPGRRAVLGDDEIRAAIVVEVGRGRPPLFPIGQHARFLTRHRGETAPAIAAQQQPASRVEPRDAGSGGEEILTE